jgi:2-C-methyl-D-erythritol 2,4-cyclodiphosphate synthase
MRVGFGIDIHPFSKGRDLVLGGVKVPHSKGLKGHSDADVLVHAVMDALLGAAGLGDIGIHFPNSDQSLKNISSLLLLKRVKTILKKEKFKIENIDSTLQIEVPKVAPFLPLMRQNIAMSLGLALHQVNVKATRAEKLGFVGEEKGVVAYAVCMIR